ncbi:MAG: DUF3783 domain-containing protein [Treponema sp.]|jgi:hypothetical protein|nr:DUF3783 domain-containing protein [Treponema sp.]
METPVIFVHGLSREVLFKIVEAVKKTAGEEGVDPNSIAFASSTVNNMDWKIRKLIREVRREHEMMNRKKGAE